MSIWDHKEIRRSIEAKHLITLNEGNTILQEIKDVRNNSIFIKREDKNPTGSWKDRGTAYLLTKLITDNVTDIVLSSSGNAAISLAEYIKDYSNHTVHIVISPNISSEKFTKLQELQKYSNIKLHTDTHTKKKRASLIAQTGGFLWSTSNNNDVLTGYWSLGFELAKVMQGNLQKKHCIIAPVSSGAAFVGIAEGVHSYFEHEHLLPHMIACQTQSCHPLIEDFQTTQEHSLADAIVDKTLIRKMQISKIIQNTSGNAFVITNKELTDAKQWAETHRVKDLSYTSLLSLAGYLKMKDEYEDTYFYCIASGR